LAVAISPDLETWLLPEKIAMCQRSVLHRLVDSLLEEDLTTAGRLLVGLTITADPVERALLLAQVDDEPDRDDDDGSLTEARLELARGGGISTEELERELEAGARR
jgi:hypothetical protein